MATKPLPPAVFSAATAIAVVNDIVNLLRVVDRVRNDHSPIVHNIQDILRKHQVPFAGDNHEVPIQPKNYMGEG